MLGGKSSAEHQLQITMRMVACYDVIVITTTEIFMASKMAEPKCAVLFDRWGAYAKGFYIINIDILSLT